MVHVKNATLAGGVAISSAAVLISPATAEAVGVVAGILIPLQASGVQASLCTYYTRLQPFRPNW